METSKSTAVIRAASDEEKRLLLIRQTYLVERRMAPTTSYPRRTLDWPAGPLQARVLVGGIKVPDVDDGYDDAIKLDWFLVKYAPNGLAFWALGEVNEILVGQRPYSALREWVKSEFIVSPCVFLSLDTDTILITDEQLRYLVVGGQPACIDVLDDQFGGRRSFCDKLAKHIDSGDIGFGEEDAAWARRFLLHWSCET